MKTVTELSSVTSARDPRSPGAANEYEVRMRAQLRRCGIADPHRAAGARSAHSASTGAATTAPVDEAHALQEVVAAWPRLAPAVRRGILTLVRADQAAGRAPVGEPVGGRR